MRILGFRVEGLGLRVCRINFKGSHSSLDAFSGLGDLGLGVHGVPEQGFAFNSPLVYPHTLKGLIF